MSLPKLLVIGASGLVGSELMKRAHRFDAYGVARHRAGLASSVMDLEDVQSIDGVVRAVNPSLVMVAAAWPWVDGCEQDPSRSERENVQTVKNLLQVLGSKVRIGFFSTDHVFDGAAEAYDETAAPNPLNVYACHKRDVEMLLLNRGRSLIFRTSYVFGAELKRKNFMYRVMDAAAQKSALTVPSRQAGMPTWSQFLATSALDLLAQEQEGIFHLVGPDVLTKGEWAQTLVAGLGLPSIDILEVPVDQAQQVAPRPERVRLVSTRHALKHPPLLELLTTERDALMRKVEC
jgi:dTDP-4-dehydrorhamnose reductase